MPQVCGSRSEPRERGTLGQSLVAVLAGTCNLSPQSGQALARTTAAQTGRVSGQGENLGHMLLPEAGPPHRPGSYICTWARGPLSGQRGCCRLIG